MTCFLESVQIATAYCLSAIIHRHESDGWAGLNEILSGVEDETVEAEIRMGGQYTAPSVSVRFDMITRAVAKADQKQYNSNTQTNVK